MSRSLLAGGRILAVVDGTPAIASALLVEDEHVRWIGSLDNASAPTDGVDEMVQLDGALVTPAFEDAHVHTTETGLALQGVDLSDAPSLAIALDRVADAARRSGGRPILGHGWDERTWPEGRPPTRQELDRAAYGGVVYLSRVDVHSAVVSSALAQAAGSRGLPGWSEDGRVEREAHHAARDATRAGLTAAARRDLHLAALDAAAAAGIGSVHEMSAPHIASEDDLRELMELSGERPDRPEVRAYRGQLVATEDEARKVAARFDGDAARPRTGRLLGLAGDLCADGSIGSHTAALREPYADRPGHTGFGYLSAEQIEAHVVACTGAGLSAGFHVIGDAALDAVVQGFAAAADRLGAEAIRAGRHRLEHVEMVDAGHLAELARLGLTASVQPVFDAWWGGPDGMYAARLGPQRGPRLNPFRDFHDAGIPLLLGSDTPITPFDAWGAVRGWVHHHDPVQRVDLRTALAAHAPALEVGSPASYAVWDAPARTPDGLPDLTPGTPAPTCLRTVVRGTLAYQREGALR